jgi:RND family efflux transporter MFP subunit
VGRRLKPLSLVLILILVLAICVTGCGKKKAVEKETELSVNVAKASVQDIAKTESFSGIIRGKNEVYIMPKAAARVTGIYVKPGDKVSAGQTLITLDNSDYEAALKRAEAGLALAEAGKRTNELNLEQARINYERTKSLHDAGAVSDQQLEAAQTQYLSLSAGTVEASVAQAQAGLLEVRKQMENCNITSPINGVVGNINLSLGDNALPASQAAIVTETGQLEVEVLVGEAEIGYIQQGSSVEVVVNAVRDKPFKGIVENISTVADTAKHTYPDKVSLGNKDGLIRSGMFAEVRISTISKRNVVCVPANAVVPMNGRTVVYIVDKDKRARQVDVTTGIENSKYIEIVKGLKSGQQIITKGNTLINEGTLVRVVGGGSK